MPLPDRAALDRIHVVLWARLAGTIGDAAAFAAIALAIEATGRALHGDPDTAARLDLADWLMAQGATFDLPDGDGHVWAHWVAGDVRRSVNVSAADPARTLAELKMGLP